MHNPLIQLNLNIFPCIGFTIPFKSRLLFFKFIVDNYLTLLIPVLVNSLSLLR